MILRAKATPLFAVTNEYKCLNSRMKPNLKGVLVSIQFS